MYTQKIIGYPKKENAEYPDTFVRTIKHEEPLTKHKSKMVKLRQLLNKKYGVYSFTQLEQRGQELINIRKDILKKAGF